MKKSRVYPPFFIVTISIKSRFFWKIHPFSWISHWIQGKSRLFASTYTKVDSVSCAAKAIFYCPTMNSHRPRSQNTAKEQALIPEKDSKRTWSRCHVSLEKSSKNYKPLEKWAKPNLLPDITPQPANFSGEYFRRFATWWSQIRHSGWPKQGRGWGDSRFDLAH